MTTTSTRLTPKRRLADLELRDRGHVDLGTFLNRRRGEGKRWRDILRELEDYGIDLTLNTIMKWHPEIREANQR
jgi:hypothetical protein